MLKYDDVMKVDFGTHINGRLNISQEIFDFSENTMIKSESQLLKENFGREFSVIFEICDFVTKGYLNDKCTGKEVAIHTLPINTCHPDHSACDGPNDPIDGYAYLPYNQFMLCCPDCKNVTKYS